MVVIYPLVSMIHVVEIFRCEWSDDRFAPQARVGFRM